MPPIADTALSLFPAERSDDSDHPEWILQEACAGGAAIVRGVSQGDSLR